MEVARSFITTISSIICTLTGGGNTVWIPLAIYLEKAMATHSSTLAWKIPWMEKPGRLQSMGLLRVRHD